MRPWLCPQLALCNVSESSLLPFLAPRAFTPWPTSSLSSSSASSSSSNRARTRPPHRPAHARRAAATASCLSRQACTRPHTTVAAPLAEHVSSTLPVNSASRRRQSPVTTSNEDEPASPSPSPSLSSTAPSQLNVVRRLDARRRDPPDGKINAPHKLLRYARFTPVHAQAGPKHGAVHRPHLPSISTHWTNAIAAMSLPFETGIPDEHRNATAAKDHLRLALPAEHDLPAAFLGQLQAADNVPHLRSCLLSLPPAVRSQAWPALMLHYLHKRPQASLDFLHASLSDPLPSHTQAADALNLIAYTLLGIEPQLKKRRASAVRILAVLRDILRRYPTHPNHPTPSSRTIAALVQALPTQDSLALYELFRSCSAHMPKPFHFHFAHLFADIGHFQSSFRCLSDAASLEDPEQPSQHLRNACTHVLRRAHLHPDASANTSQLLASFRAWGVGLTTTVCNVLIANAIDAKKYSVAWRIYLLMLRDDHSSDALTPDRYTYTILLKGARLNRDRRTFQRLYEHIRYRRLGFLKQGSLGPALATEIIASSAEFSRRSDFGRPLRTFELFHDLQPLKDIGIIPQTHTSRYLDEYPDPRPHPSTITVALMLHYYVLSQPSIRPVARLYNLFKNQLAARNPTAIALAALHHPWHIFLKKFGTRPGSLMLWSQIVRDMTMPLEAHKPIKYADVHSKAVGRDLKDHDASTLAFDAQDLAGPPPANDTLFEDESDLDPASLLNPDTLRRYSPPGRNLETWNIIMHALASAGHVKTVEKIFESLKQRGGDLKPDQFSLNSLVTAYARTQRVDKLATMLKGLQVVADHGPSLGLRAPEHVYPKPEDAVQPDLVVDNALIKALRKLTPNNRARLGTLLRDDSSRSALAPEDDLFEPEYGASGSDERPQEGRGNEGSGPKDEDTLRSLM